MKKILFIALFLISPFLFSTAVAQEMERYKGGVLDNGLKYYIKHSSLQKGEVSFYIMQNVGAILENEQENGLAHFLEHMAFNGTNNFQDGIMSMLIGRGIKTFNAYTSVNETIYNIDNIPTNMGGLVDTCMLILRDWSNGILLHDKDIEDERGVIIEEWRKGAGVGRRMQDASAKIIYNGSRYATCNVIGTLEALQSFSCETLRNFYQKWYRPNLQAIVIVGDIDEVEYEQKVKELFGDIKVAADAPTREEFKIENNAKPIYNLLLDTENKSRYISVTQRVEKRRLATYPERKKASISQNLFNSMVKRRISRLKNSDNEQFLSCHISFGEFVRGYNALNITIVPTHNADLVGFEQVMGIWENIRVNGFTKEEFDEQQQEAYRQIKQQQTKMDKFSNGYYVNMFKNNFFGGLSMADIKENIEENMEYILELTLEDVNGWLASWSGSDENRIIIVAGNDAAYPYLNETQVLKTLAEVKNKKAEVATYKKTIDELIDFEIIPGKLVKTKKLERFDATVWTLSNGATVLYKNLKDDEGEFTFVAGSHGGRSMVAAKDIPIIRSIGDLSMKSGIYKHDRNALQDFIQGKNIRLNLRIDETTEGIGGGASVEDAELFFQLFYLLSQKPNFSRDKFDKYVEQGIYMIENTPKTPMDIVSDSINKLLSVPSERVRPINRAYIESMNFDRIMPVYNERFGNAADFTYCIIGDIDIDKALELACKYVGSLPSKKGKKEKAMLYDFSKKELDLNYEIMAELPDNKAMISISYSNSLKLSKLEGLSMSVLISILQNRYFDKIREQAGGTYSVNVNGGHSSFLKNTQSLSIQFDTEKDKADALKILVYNELDNICKNGVSDSEIANVTYGMKRQKVQINEKQGVAYWLNVLNNYMDTGEDITLPDNFENIIDKINSDVIKDVLNKILKKAKHREIVVKAK